MKAAAMSTPVLSAMIISTALAMAPSGATAAADSGAAPATFVYVSNSESHDISVYGMQRDSGALAPVATVPVGGTAMPMAVALAQRRLYVGIRTAPFHAAVFDIDPRSGKLAPLADAPLADSMAYLSLDNTGRYLFSASYGGAKFSVNPVDAGGMPGAPQQTVATGPMAHSIRAAPDNRYVFGAVLGADVLMRYTLDAASGQLGDGIAALTLPPKSGPRFFVFSPDRKFIYLVDELDAKLHVLAFDAARGEVRLLQSVSVLPDNFSGKPWGADVHLTPDGAFLYASERSSSTLSGFRVDRTSGRLSKIADWPTETQPRGFAIAAGGKFLIAAGEKSGHISVYRIDAEGRLDAVGRYAAGSGPNWIEIVDFN